MVGMTPAAFSRTLADAAPPKTVTPVLAALWWAKKGNWDKAHKLVQDESGQQAAWVHAYLHRVEGDLANASYWYRQARKPICDAPLETEWAAIVETLLD